jgi:hypothetical protein
MLRGGVLMADEAGPPPLRAAAAVEGVAVLAASVVWLALLFPLVELI